MSERLRKQAASGVPWPIEQVHRRDVNGIAVLTLRRFKVLNALNAEVLAQLSTQIERIAGDAAIRGVVIRGFGTRAFVSGADITELAAMKTPQDAVVFARRGQHVLSQIENLKKPVIAAMNGLAFGGGNELAMACHARLAAEGQKVFAGQPEPNLGIIPGYGGTQRLPRLIGVARAWPLLRAGKPISSAQAKALGLVREEVPSAELLDRAIALALEVAAGKVTLKPMVRGPIAGPESPSESLPDVDVGHLSRAVDAIVQRAVTEGARRSLDEGLRIEAEMFGECVKLEDYRIGTRTFLEKGAKAKAEFVNR